MDVVYYSLGVLFLVIACIAIVYSIKILFTYRDYQSLLLVTAIFALDVWLLTKALFFIESLLPLSATSWRQMYSVGNIGLVGGVISFIHISDHRFNRKTTRFFSRAGFILYSMILALSFVDLALQQPLFYPINRVNENWYVDVHPLGAIILIAALSFTVLIFFSFLNWANYLAKTFEPEKKTSRYMVLISSLSAVIILGITIVGLTSFDDIPLNLGIIIILPTVILFSSFSIYLTFSKPFFLMLRGINPAPLLTRGYVGYFLAAFMDSGPETLFIAPIFKEKMKIDDFSLHKVSLGVLSLISVLDDRNTVENVSLLPLISEYGVAALAFTFSSKNSATEDQQLKKDTATLFTILFPPIMTLAVNNMSNTLTVVLEQIKRKQTVQELVDQEFLNELTVKALKRLLE
ncbi:MAG: hypothetical protein ACFFD4_40365 [Candidatus Odinarchaeota archaeon]